MAWLMGLVKYRKVCGVAYDAILREAKEMGNEYKKLL